MPTLRDGNGSDKTEIGGHRGAWVAVGSGPYGVIAGFVMLLGCFLPEPAAAWVTVPVAALAAAIPTVYSYWYYKKHGL